MTYKFLLFDLDHTLLDFALAEESALTLLLEEAEVEDLQSYKDYYVPMNKAMWHELTLGNLSKKELIQTRFSRLFAHFGKDVDGIFYADRYQEFLSQQGQVLAGAETLLKQLADKGYRIFAATNGVTSIQKGRLAQSGIETYFEQIFISDEMGYHKPDKEFYEMIRESVEEMDFTQTLMIGDSLLADILGGNQAGIDTVWFNPECMDNHTRAKPTYTIREYEDLLRIL